MPEYTTDEWGIPYPSPSDKIAGDTENLRLALKSLADKTGRGLTHAVATAEEYADDAAQAVNWLKGVLPTDTDLNTLTSDEHAGLWSLPAYYSYPNSPVVGAAFILVEPSLNGVRQRVSTASGATVLERQGFKLAGGDVDWKEWEYGRRSSYPAGQPLDTMRTHGDFIIESDVLARNIPDWPTDLVSPRAAELSVRRTQTGLTRQTLRLMFRDNLTLSRVTQALSPVPFPFGEWKIVGAGGGSTPTASDAGLVNDLLRQDFSRRHGGTIRTGGRGAVALRCDHGLVNFRDKVLPLCEAAGIVPSLALNSRNWNYSENVGVDAGTVNGWVQSGKVEIWNHSATHTNPSSVTALEDEIITGLEELRSQLPAAQIDGWAIPGVGAPDPYMGMGTITSVKQLYSSDAGRMILSHHAVTTGHIPGTYQRVLDGNIRQGQLHRGMESRTPEELKSEIDAAITNRTGLQLMIHPSLIDEVGYMTSDQLAEVITYISAKSQAEELVMLTPYQLMLADAS